jgi:hypothetical protein
MSLRRHRRWLGSMLTPRVWVFFMMTLSEIRRWKSKDSRWRGIPIFIFRFCYLGWSFSSFNQSKIYGLSQKLSLRIKPVYCIEVPSYFQNSGYSLLLIISGLNMESVTSDLLPLTNFHVSNFQIFSCISSAGKRNNRRIGWYLCLLVFFISSIYSQLKVFFQ